MLMIERPEAGWTVAAVASAQGVDGRTVRKWPDRFRAEGAAGREDRSSRPHASPSRLDRAAEAARGCRLMADEIQTLGSQSLGLKDRAELRDQFPDVTRDRLRRADRLGESAPDFDGFRRADRLDGFANIGEARPNILCGQPAKVDSFPLKRRRTAALRGTWLSAEKFGARLLAEGRGPESNLLCF